jgi:hypothetical protein
MRDVTLVVPRPKRGRQMNKNAGKTQRGARRTGSKHAEHVHEWIPINFDSDFQATALFSLLGVALSLAVLHAIPLTEQALDLLTADF